MRLFVFAALILPPLLFLSAQVVSAEVSVITGRIVLKFWDMVDIVVQLCKLKMLDSKAGPRACRKQPKFCPDYFSRVVLTLFDMIYINRKFATKFEI